MCISGGHTIQHCCFVSSSCVMEWNLHTLLLLLSEKITKIYLEECYDQLPTRLNCLM